MRCLRRCSVGSPPFAKKRSPEALFDAAKRWLLTDRDFLLQRAWCAKWQIPPNDPRVLNMPLEEMELWLVADRIESWADATDERGQSLGRKIEEATMGSAFPSVKSTYDAFLDEVEEEMGSTSSFEEIEAEAQRRLRNWKNRL